MSHLPRIPATDSELDALLARETAFFAHAEKAGIEERILCKLARRAGALPPSTVAPRIATYVIRMLALGDDIDLPEVFHDIETRISELREQVALARRTVRRAYALLAVPSEERDQVVALAKAFLTYSLAAYECMCRARRAAQNEWLDGFMGRSAEYRP